MSNRLSQETSPYLQQHADNPVDWYPWGQEALQRARNEDKPLDGMTLFFTDFDRTAMTVREIEKLGRAAVDSNEIFIDGLEIPEENVVGEVGFVLSMRIWVPAVITASAFPTLSTEKYLIVYVPSEFAVHAYDADAIDATAAEGAWAPAKNSRRASRPQATAAVATSASSRPAIIAAVPRTPRRYTMP